MKDPAQIAEQTGASTACGSCRALVCELAGESARAGGSQSRVPAAGVMLAASLVAAVLVLVMATAAPIPRAESVQAGWRKIDVLWRSDLARQISGFTLLGLLLLGLVFSLRKRTQWFSLGSYGFWRATHGVLGALVLLAMVIHTGLKLGENLNLVLAIVFLSTAMLGSVAGIASSIESKLEGTSAMFVRRWRPRMTTLHSLLFWPLPALIAVHIFSFYWYSD